MVDHKQTYQSEAEQYDQLVSFEDYEHNLLPAIRHAGLVDGMSILELGAGTGRLTTLLQPISKEITALDLSPAMLAVARNKLVETGSVNWCIAASDHRQLPVKSKSVDLVIAGWSVCYLVDWYPSSWQTELEKAFSEMKRVLIPGGKIILVETQGTGFETPHPPDHLHDYFGYLDKLSFDFSWIRTDYKFDDLSSAISISGFFFGEEMAAKVIQNRWVILPECTGIFWKSF